MLIASDTSPLIAFSGINRLDVLKAMFHHVVVPPAVYAELVIDGRESSQADAARSALREGDWLAMWQENFTRIQGAPATLSRADAEVISLAKNLGCECLMDERRGRGFAESHEVQVIGSLGVLMRAKLDGTLPLLRPMLDGMVKNGNFFAQSLISKVLRLAGEE